MQGENSLELYVMCEIPSNVTCADAFADISKRRKRKIGICGQGPSDFPDFATFLVEEGIDSMSLIPDTVIKTRMAVHEKEKELGIAPM